MNRRYFTPSEYELLTSIRTKKLNNNYKVLTAEEAEFFAELCVETAGQFGSATELIIKTWENAYTDKHIAEKNQRAVEKAAAEVTETFQTVASSVRDYVRANAGSLSVLQLLYDTYSRADVQRVCSSNIWLINRQIEIALSAYIQQHQDEAYTFVTTGKKDAEDF